MEGFIITRDLLLMNVDSEIPTFQGSRGRTCIDLTLCNSTLAQKMRVGTCGEEVSCAENIKFFENDSRANGKWTKQHTVKRKNTKAEKWGTFTHNLAKNLKENFDCAKDMTDWTARDKEISQKIKLDPDTDRVIQKFTSAITVACDTTFQVTRRSNQAVKKRRVPWWTKELMLLR